jgi:signal transduction histidine kinase
MDGELSISAKRENPDASIRQLRIAFKDTGPPIPQGVDLEVLWKDFSKDSHLGNVMYARENVRRMGGELLIDETVQTGTQIEMVLPLVDVDGRRL